MEKLRTAIVGFGFMGKTHALNILKSDLMTLAAVVDKRPDALTAQTGGNIDTGTFDAGALDNVKLYASTEDCLNSEQIDLVYVCVHTPAHFETAMTALRHGANVFIEKPFVIDVSEGISLISEARNRNLQLGVAHVVRFMAPYMQLKRICDEGIYGKLRFLSLTRFAGVPGWGDWLKMQRDFGKSGGALFDLVIHDVDFARYLLGEPDEIHATILPGLLSRHDYVCTFWDYPGRDLHVKIEGGNTFPSNFPFEASYKAVFRDATLMWTSNAGSEIKVITDDAVTSIPLGDATDGYRDEGQYFAQCILNRQFPATCSAQSSLDTVKICHRLAGI